MDRDVVNGCVKSYLLYLKVFRLKLKLEKNYGNG